jgi:hypothetical protein
MFHSDKQALAHLETILHLRRSRDSDSRRLVHNFHIAKNNRPIGLRRYFQRKRSGVKRIGRLFEALPVQAVHARLSRTFRDGLKLRGHHDSTGKADDPLGVALADASAFCRITSISCVR